MFNFHEIFGNKNKTRNQTSNGLQRARSHSSRTLRLESLEQRQLLSVCTWTGGNWSDNRNWSNHQLPLSGDSIVLQNSSDFRNDLASAPNLSGITFDTTHSANLIGNPITLNSGATIKTTGRIETTPFISAPLILNGTTTVDVSAYLSITISACSGSGGLQKTGPGVLKLSGNSAYSGYTIVSAGTLQAGSNTAFSANSVLNVDGGVVDLNGYNQTVFSLRSTITSSTGVIANNAVGTSVVITSAGDNPNDGFYGTLADHTGSSGGTLGLTVTVNKANPIGVNTLYLCNSGNTYSGETRIVAGTAAAALTTWVANGLSPKSSIYVGTQCSLNLANQNAQIAGLEGAGTVTSWSSGTATSTLTINNTLDKTFSGVIADGMATSKIALTKTGNRKQALSGNNTYSGYTIVSAGTLQAGSSTGFSANSVLNVDGGVVDLNGYNQTVFSLRSTTSSSTGVVANNAVGTSVVITSAGDNPNDGFYGTLADHTGSSGGTLGLTVTVNKANPIGVNTLYLCNSGNTYSGETRIVAGTAAAALTTWVTNGFSPNSSIYVGSQCSLKLANQNARIAGLEGSGTVTSWPSGTATSTLTIDNPADKTFAGVIADGIATSRLALTIADNTRLKLGNGKQTLSGNNTYSGYTIVSAGTLRAGSSTAFSANSVLNVDGGVVDLNGYNQTVFSLRSTITSSTGVVANNADGTSVVITSAGDNPNDGFYGTLVDHTGSSGGTLGLTVTVNKANPIGVNTLYLCNSGNTYSGETRIVAGTAAAALTTWVANGLSPKSSIYVGTQCSLNLANQNAQIAGLEGFGMVTSWSSGTATSTLTINNTLDKTFSGVIADGTATSKIALN